MECRKTSSHFGENAVRACRDATWEAKANLKPMNTNPLALGRMHLQMLTELAEVVAKPFTIIASTWRMGMEEEGGSRKLQASQPLCHS